MTKRFPILATLGLLTAFIATPAHVHGLQAQAAEPHDHDHTATPNAQDKTADPSREAMMASDAKLDELVQKMAAAKGSAKTDAMATLLATLVQEQRTMHASMMTNMSMMSNMMDKMGGMGGRGDAGSTMPKK